MLSYSIYRNKNFLLPRIARYLKENNFTKLNEIYNENIKGDFSHAEDICAAIYKILRLRKFIKTRPKNFVMVKSPCGNGKEKALNNFI